MIKRSTWVMLILLAGLAALAYYLTLPDNYIKKTLDAGKTPTVGVSTTRLIEATDGQINGMDITAADGHSISLKHESAGWTFSVASKAPVLADQSATEQAASQAQELMLIDPEIKPATDDLSGFGLDKPAYTYKVSLDSGKILNFKIGRATITGDGYYLQKENGKIGVVDKYNMDALLALLKQPPAILTATPSLAPATEVPTGTITPTAPAITPTVTSSATPNA